MSLTVYPDPATGGGVAIGDTVTGATAGSVFFAGAAGILAQNNTAFQWIGADTQLQLTAGAATKTPLEINLFGLQSADAFQVKDSSTAVVANITSAGKVFATSGPYYNSVTYGFAGLTATGIGGASGFVSLVVGGLAVLSVSCSNVGIATGGELGWSATSGAFDGANDIALARAAAGVLKVTDGSDGTTGGGGIQFTEMTAPTAPSANNVILFSRDNGAGKTQLMALFATGAAQQVAIEP